ncbi:hypothetical protein [Aquiflexum sp.]|uniref:hypothetical protein n=1 Tax=Aquiflexum sp. TaxID=1872584 RepID=UPI0035932E7A
MKNLSIACLILVLTGNLSAQSKFGILTYQIPDHWEVAQVADNLVLFNPSSPECRIALLPTTSSIIDTEDEFLELRSQKINELGFQNHPSNPIEKIEEEGWIILRTAMENYNPRYILRLMVTLSNSNETTGVIFEANSLACYDEIMQILGMLGIEPTPIPVPAVQDPKKPQSKGKAQPMKDLRGVADPQKGKGKGKN